MGRQDGWVRRAQATARLSPAAARGPAETAAAQGHSVNPTRANEFTFDWLAARGAPHAETGQTGIRAVSDLEIERDPEASLLDRLLSAASLSVNSLNSGSSNSSKINSLRATGCQRCLWCVLAGGIARLASVPGTCAPHVFRLDQRVFGEPQISQRPKTVLPSRQPSASRHKLILCSANRLTRLSTHRTSLRGNVFRPPNSPQLPSLDSSTH